MALTAPLWTVKVRLITYREKFNIRSYDMVFRIVKEMYTKEGIRSFYRGFLPSMLLSSYGIIQMWLYETLNYMVGYNPKDTKNKVKWFIPFLTGAFAKSFASSVLLPMTVIRHRLQMKKYTKS